MGTIRRLVSRIWICTGTPKRGNGFTGLVSSSALAASIPCSVKSPPAWTRIRTCTSLDWGQTRTDRRGSSSISGTRNITIKLEGQLQRGHGSDGHNGLLSCIHPIAKGSDLEADLAEAAERASDEAYEALDRSGLAMNPKSRSLKTSMANAAAALVLEADCEGPRSAHAQYCLGVMLWKGLGIKRYVIRMISTMKPLHFAK
jgi:hypothetical protein